MAEENDYIEMLELQFPAASGVAFATAREQTLAAGLSVLESADGAIYEVFPDGRRRFVKAIEPPISVVAATKIILG